ncbi:hypothetical protein CYMTET_54735 [Cymbomonas tetramitiformis]|uniref:Uncharacterized protein n=1 Tax=Cymbomonas tetramitiformis TaxID=36881 RepID=A0AAE0BEA6_9CHLO|nr:hypothetical protein CYMTET_54735 [Cymbomonas tetramitiformis]
MFLSGYRFTTQWEFRFSLLLDPAEPAAACSGTSCWHLAARIASFSFTTNRVFFTAPVQFLERNQLPDFVRHSHTQPDVIPHYVLPVMSTDRVTLARRLRVARGSPGGHSSTTPTPSASPDRGGTGDPIVRMSQLTTKPTPVSRAATSAEFYADPTVWVSTPVKPSQRTEFADKLDYAFSYGEELAKLLRTHGFKSNVGLTLDGPEAESDFAVLLANMAHVFGPVSRDDIAKLLDLDNEYSDYHIVLNGLVYAVLPTVLRSTALTLYEESAEVHPRDGRCALQRLRFHVEGIGDPDAHRFWYSDADMVADLYSVLRASAAVSPHVAPLYLVVLRDLGANIPFTFAALTLRIAKVFRDEYTLARLSAPSPPASGGAGRGGAGGGGGRGGGGSGGGGKPTVGSMHALGWKKLAPPLGEWKPVRNARYLQWEGTGLVCVTCFRLWAVTTGHLDTEGACPYSCSASFAPGRAPATASTTAPPPPMSAWPPAPPPAARANSLQALEPPPLDDAAQPGAAAMAVRFSGVDLHDEHSDEEQPDATPPAFHAVHDDDDEEDWPAFRSSPVWIPSFAGSTAAALSITDVTPSDVPAEAP